MTVRLLFMFFLLRSWAEMIIYSGDANSKANQHPSHRHTHQCSLTSGPSNLNPTPETIHRQKVSDGEGHDDN